MKTYCGFAVLLTACLLHGATVVAQTNLPAPPDYEAILVVTRQLELPAKAAALVTGTPAGDRSAAALAVIRAVSRVNASAVPAVVGAVAKSEPTVARAVADEAAKLQPKLERQIRDAAAPRFEFPRMGNPAPGQLPGPPYKKGHYKSTWWPPKER